MLYSYTDFSCSNFLASLPFVSQPINIIIIFTLTKKCPLEKIFLTVCDRDMPKLRQSEYSKSWSNSIWLESAWHISILKSTDYQNNGQAVM